MTHISEIAGLFGRDEFPYAMFYCFGFGLRFELATPDPDYGDGRLTRFMSALDRARPITHAVFPNLAQTTVLISQGGGDKSAPTKRGDAADQVARRRHQQHALHRRRQPE